MSIFKMEEVIMDLRPSLDFQKIDKQYNISGQDFAKFKSLYEYVYTNNENICIVSCSVGTSGAYDNHIELSWAVKGANQCSPSTSNYKCAFKLKLNNHTTLRDFSLFMGKKEVWLYFRILDQWMSLSKSLTIIFRSNDFLLNLR